MPAQDLSHSRVLVPDPMTGEVLGKLNRMGGLVTGVLAHLTEFKAWLQKYSQDQGEVSER